MGWKAVCIAHDARSASAGTSIRDRLSRDRSGAIYCFSPTERFLILGGRTGSWHVPCAAEDHLVKSVRPASHPCRADSGPPCRQPLRYLSEPGAEPHDRTYGSTRPERWLGAPRPRQSYTGGPVQLLVPARSRRPVNPSPFPLSLSPCRRRKLPQAHRASPSVGAQWGAVAVVLGLFLWWPKTARSARRCVFASAMSCLAGTIPAIRPRDNPCNAPQGQSSVGQSLGFFEVDDGNSER